MAPPLPEASQPSKTTHSGGPISPGPICPPSSSRRCTSRSCTAASSFFSWALDSRSVRSTSSSRLMRRGCRNWVSFASPPVPRPGQWDDGAVMTALPLVFDAPRRGKPPRHLADLTREEARAAVTELGQPAFRADQLARHFYRGVSEPAQMTDLPAAVREDLAQALLPGLLGPRAGAAPGPPPAGAPPAGRRRTHPQDPLAAARRRARRERPHALSGPGDGVHLEPGRLRHGLPLLRHRPGRADPQPLGRRDHRPGGRGRGGDGERRDPGRSGAAVQRGLHGHGGAAGQLPTGAQDPGRAADPRAARARALPALGHRLHGGPGAGHPPAHRGGPARHPRGQPARTGRRAARHPRADQHPLEGRRGRRRGGRLRRTHRPPVLGGVRAHPRRQRPARTRRSPRPAPGGPARARETHPAPPDTRQSVGRQPAAGPAGVRRPPAGCGRADDGPRHPRAGHRRRVRAARRGRPRRGRPEPRGAGTDCRAAGRARCRGRPMSDPADAPPQAEAHEHSHADVSGGWLRAAVFGAMDGLVTNTALVAGVGGGGAAPRAIVLAGVASLVAGAISMALGEYTSVKTQNEQLDLEMQKERRELERNPEGELAELTEMLRVRGVDDALAREVAVQLSRDPESALRLHIVAELGLSPEDKPSPRVAALSSFITFATGAVIPLLPYLFGVSLLWVALVCGAVGLAAAGALSSRFTPRPWWYAGLRQLLFGAAAAGITYVVGAAIGVSVS